MANKVTMNICGQEYTLVADESAAYMEKVGALVDERMRQVLDALHVSQTDAAVLAAVNLADELLKNQAAAENLRRQVKNYLDEATQAKNEASELKRQLSEEQRVSLIGLLWEIVYADGERSEMEDHAIWRIADLLAVSGRERIMKRQEVAERVGAVVSQEEPEDG